MPTDIADEQSVSALFERIEREWGSAHVLVNNAGTFVSSKVIDHTVADWERVQAVNVRGTFLCSRAFLRACREKRHGGSIVNIASISGIRGPHLKFPGFGAYIASKFAVVGITEALAIEGKEYGVRANCLAPGSVDTEMLRNAAPHVKTDVRPEDVAQTVLHLADDGLSHHLNGALLEVFSDL
ncbi:SDR family oxidoreductase [bacterium]|nr:SDR family oxidoreductase [bacterium]